MPEHASYLAHHHKGGPPASAAAAGARRPSHQGGQLFSTSSTATTGGGADADGHGHAAAAAVAAKQIADKLANTFSNFGRSLLRRAPHGEGAGGGGGAAPGAAAVVVAQQHAQHGDKQLQQQAGGSGAHTPPHQHSHAGPLAAGTLLPEGMEPTPAQVFRHSLDLLLLQVGCFWGVGAAGLGRALPGHGAAHGGSCLHRFAAAVGGRDGDARRRSPALRPPAGAKVRACAALAGVRVVPRHHQEEPGAPAARLHPGGCLHTHTNPDSVPSRSAQVERGAPRALDSALPKRCRV